MTGTIKVKAYRRRVQYYETDQMGIMHNSNYFRWFEEARIDFMSQTKFPYPEIEARGIILPLTQATAKFLNPAHFYDELMVKSKLTMFNGYKLSIDFEILNLTTNKLNTTGEKRYAILTKEGRPLNLEKSHRDIYDDWLSVLNYQSEA